MVYLVDVSIGLETFGMENFPPKNRVRGGIRVIGGGVVIGRTTVSVVWIFRVGRLSRKIKLKGRTCGAGIIVVISSANFKITGL